MSYVALKYAAMAQDPTARPSCVFLKFSDFRGSSHGPADGIDKAAVVLSVHSRVL